MRSLTQQLLKRPKREPLDPTDMTSNLYHFNNGNLENGNMASAMDLDYKNRQTDSSQSGPGGGTGPPPGRIIDFTLV